MKKTISNKNISLGDYFNRLIQHRALIWSLAKRDLKSKYAQTSLGFLWLVIQPAIALLIFTVFFDQLIEIDTGNVSYPVFAFSGMILWYFFTNMVNNAGTSLIQGQDLIKKIYFPKLILPISKVLVALAEFSVAVILLIILMLFLGQSISWKLILLPICVSLVVMIGACVAIWLSLMTVKRRDLQHLIPYLTNYGIWFTPVFYPTSIIPEQYIEWMYYVNPMATVIDMFRSFLFDYPFNWMYCISFVPYIFLLSIGIVIFKNKERNLADYI